MRKLLIATVLTAVSSELFAENTGSYSFMTAGHLLTACNSTEPFHYGSCLNYIAGTIDTLNMLKNLGAVAEDIYCLPDNVTQTRLRFVTVAHIASNPEFHAYVAADQIVQALGATFPCKTSSQ
jgi:hypothetical protein